MKKILSALLVAIMLLTVAPLSGLSELDFFSTTASAQTTPSSGWCGKNVVYTLDSNGNLIIRGNGDMYDYQEITNSSSFYSDSPFYHSDNIKTVTIEDGVTNIGNYAFWFCKYLTNVTISDSVTSIGYRAFEYCERLENVVIPDGVTNIGNEAFSTCEKLSSISIPNSVTNIGYDAFYLCGSLSCVTIPSSVISIGERAFNRCSSLTSIEVSAANNYYSSDSNGILYNKDKTELIQYPNGNARTSFSVSNSVINIKNCAFYKCDNLQKVTIPDSVTSIGNEAFYYCSNLTSVTMGKNVKDIGEYAFALCYSLSSIIIPNKVTSIEAGTFSYCRSLTSVKIPDSVTGIGDGAFSYCSGLTSVTVGNSVKSIDKYAFYYCTALTSVTVGNKVTNIGDSAFNYCSKIKDVYYTGSEASWSKISIGYVNSHLTRANRHYNYIDIFVPNGKYAVRVVNSDGNPLINATIVVFEGFGIRETIKTDLIGIAYFNKFSIGEINYKISADGYEDYTTAGTNYSFNENNYDIVVMYTPTESKLRLKSAVYHNTDSNNNEIGSLNRVDLIYNTKRLSMTNSTILEGSVAAGHFSLICTAIDTSYVQKYQLWQDGLKIAESTKGEFYLKIIDFSVGKNIYVITIGKNNELYKTPINLEICKDESVEDFKLSFGNKISFSVDDSIPFIGGTELSYDIPDLPFEVSVENGKVYFRINIADNGEEKTQKEQQEEINRLIDEARRLSNYKIGSHTEEKINRFLKESKKFKVPVAGDIDVKFFGAGECEWSSSGIDEVTVNLCLIINASLEKGWQTMVYVVPVTVQIKVGVETTLNAKANYNFQAKTLNGDIALNLKPYINVYGAVGVGKVLSAGAYGEANADIGIQLLGTNTASGLKSVDITGELGIKAYAANKEYKKVFTRNTWHVYTRTRSMQTMSTQSIESYSFENGMFNLDNYSLADISYMKNESEWLSPDFADFSFDSVSEQNPYQIQTLLSGTYRNSQPVIASNSSNAVMAFISADTSRGLLDYTKAVYSVYDSVSSTWSEPVQVDTNSTADTAPYLYSDGNDIWLAYQEASTSLSETFSEDYYKSSQRIVVAKFDDISKEFVIQNTFDIPNGYDRIPRVTTVNGKPYVTWISSIDSDIFGQGNNNNIIYSTLTSGTWSSPACIEENVPTITDFAIGELDDSLKVAYIKDNDSNLSTEGDLAVCVKDLSGNEVEYNDASASEIQFTLLPGETEPSFIWLSDSTLCSTMDGATVNKVADIGGRAESYAVLSDRILLTESTDNNSQIWTLVYDETENKWCNCVETTNQEKYIERLSATEFNGQTIALMTRKTVTITDSDVIDDCELAWTKIEDNTQAEIGYVSYMQEAVKQNQSLPLSVFVTNTGSTTLTDYTITVKKISGNTVTTLNPTENILPGETAEIIVNVPMGNRITLDEYTVILSADGMEHDDYSFDIGYLDFSTEIEIIKVGSLNTAAITVKNDGNSTASGTLNISGTKYTSFIKTTDIENLGAGESQTFFVDIPSDIDEDIIKATVVADGEEYYTFNNTVSAYVYTAYESEESGYIILPSLKTHGPIVDDEKNLIYGLTPGLSSINELVWIDDANFELVPVAKDGKFGTGSTVEIQKGGYAVDSYSIIVFGDVNGDSYYDGMDALIVSCIANGMLSKEDVGEAVWLAADCNHDGKINNLDVELLDEAGLQLATVNQDNQLYYKKSYVNEWYYPEGSTFISQISVYWSKNKSNCINACSSDGYNLLDMDLNYEAGGNYIYFGYKTTTDISEALRGIDFIYDKNNTSWIYNLNGADIEYTNFKGLDGHVDLNKGTNGNYIYGLQTKDYNAGSPIWGLSISDNEILGTNTWKDSSNPWIDCHWIDGTLDNEYADLNKGTRGKTPILHRTSVSVDSSKLRSKMNDAKIYLTSENNLYTEESLNALQLALNNSLPCIEALDTYAASTYDQKAINELRDELVCAINGLQLKNP